MTRTLDPGVPALLYPEQASVFPSVKWDWGRTNEGAWKEGIQPLLRIVFGETSGPQWYLPSSQVVWALGGSPCSMSTVFLGTSGYSRL